MTDLSPHARFGKMVAAERARRGWSMRELLAWAGLPAAPATVVRIEDGGGTRLDIAARVARALGLSLDGLLDPCGQCRDAPPPGFTCNTCGAEHETEAS